MSEPVCMVPSTVEQRREICISQVEKETMPLTLILSFYWQRVSPKKASFRFVVVIHIISWNPICKLTIFVWLIKRSTTLYRLPVDHILNCCFHCSTDTPELQRTRARLRTVQHAVTPTKLFPAPVNSSLLDTFRSSTIFFTVHLCRSTVVASCAVSLASSNETLHRSTYHIVSVLDLLIFSLFSIAFDFYLTKGIPRAHPLAAHPETHNPKKTQC